MRVKFSGKSSEYEIEKSHFCTNAFVVKDKIANRDATDFITSNVEFLDFSDESFSFCELMGFLEKPNDENVIVVDEFFQNDEKELNLEKNQPEQESHKQENSTLNTKNYKEISSSKNPSENLAEKDLNASFSKTNWGTSFSSEKKLDNTKLKFSLSDEISRIFDKNLFVTTHKEFQKEESLELLDTQKFEFFGNLNTFYTDEKSDFLKGMHEFSFVKIEILHYDESNDSISFELELFPRGVRYKYGIYGQVLRMILTGKMQGAELLAFLKSFVYKSKEQILGEKIFTLTLNESHIYRLKVQFTA